MPPLPEADLLWPWVRYFLEVHLPRHRGASPHTLASYRVAFRLLLLYLGGREGGLREHRLSQVDPPRILEFLTWLESPEGRGTSPQTRNCRLAALRSFFRFLELHRPPEEAARWSRLRQLPFKRTSHPVPGHLEVHELEHVFSAVPLDTPDGFRDLALLALLYNTGARADEAAGLRRAGLNLDHLPTARLLCKGSRERVCPLWPSTASLLLRYLEHHRRRPRPPAEPFVFINQRRGRLTRFGVGRIVAKYLERAAASMPALQRKLDRLSTHSLRHSTAIHLLESGAEVNVIKAWLGHGSVRTTSRYLDLDLEKHRDLLARLPLPSRLRTWEPGGGHPPSPDDQEVLDAWLDHL